MRRTKNNEISSRADAMVAKRWGVIENDIMSHTPQKIESVEDFLIMKEVLQDFLKMTKVLNTFFICGK